MVNTKANSYSDTNSSTTRGRRSGKSLCSEWLTTATIEPLEHDSNRASASPVALTLATPLLKQRRCVAYVWPVFNRDDDLYGISTIGIVSRTQPSHNLVSVCPGSHPARLTSLASHSFSHAGLHATGEPCCSGATQLTPFGRNELAATKRADCQCPVDLIKWLLNKDFPVFYNKRNISKKRKKIKGERTMNYGSVTSERSNSWEACSVIAGGEESAQAET